MAGSFTVFPPPWEPTDSAKQRSAAKRGCWGSLGHTEDRRRTETSYWTDNQGSRCQSREDDVRTVGLSVGEQKCFLTVTNVAESHSNGHVCTGSRMTIGQHGTLRHMPKQG